MDINILMGIIKVPRKVRAPWIWDVAKEASFQSTVIWAQWLEQDKTVSKVWVYVSSKWQFVVSHTQISKCAHSNALLLHTGSEPRPSTHMGSGLSINKTALYTWAAVIDTSSDHAGNCPVFRSESWSEESADTSISRCLSHHETIAQNLATRGWPHGPTAAPLQREASS